MWQRILIVTLVLLIIAVGALYGYGSMRWNKETQALRHRLDSGKLPRQATTFDPKELDGLPVQRYFQTALTPEQVMISALDIEHAGTFNLHENGETWLPFTSNQRVITQRAGFDWNAAIRMFPGVHARVHDACVAGEGLWQGRVWNYTLRDGMRMPLQGEVEWLLPEGAKPYWRARITSLRYQFN